MKILVWVVMALLALAFIMTGAMKATQPKEKLQANMAWVESFSPNTIKMIGILEIMGGIGLVLPAAFHILPWLTPVAAAGLCLTMVGAVYTHYHLKEAKKGMPAVVLFLLSALVLFGSVHEHIV